MEVLRLSQRGDSALLTAVENALTAAEVSAVAVAGPPVAGAAQARRRGFILHHTTIAHTMDVDLLPRLIRIGRQTISERGVRSAEKAVSPLSWFTSLSCEEVSRHMQNHFAREFHTRESELSLEEIEAARSLVASKYSTPAWINRLP